jgi:phage shock protein C
MRLKRSTRDVMIAGVCAGMAHELGWPVRRTRVAYVLLSILSAAFPGILVYVLLWFVMPKTDEW